jgi:hypothetical protein
MTMDKRGRNTIKIKETMSTEKENRQGARLATDLSLSYKKLFKVGYSKLFSSPPLSILSLFFSFRSRVMV